jgi:hypothetical protein
MAQMTNQMKRCTEWKLHAAKQIATAAMIAIAIPIAKFFNNFVIKYKYMF